MADLSETPPSGLARRVGVGMLWNQSSKLAEVALTFGTAVLVVRGLNPQRFGTYSLLTNLAGAASVFIPVVTTESLGAVFPRLRTRPERVWMVAAVATLRVAVIGAVSAVVVLEWDRIAPLIGLAGIPRVLAVAAVVYWVTQDLLNTVTGYYGAEIEMRPVALWRTTGLVLTLLAVVVLAGTNSFTEGRVLAVVTLGYGVSLAGLALGLLRMGRPQAPSRGEIRHAFGLTRHTWLIGVLGFTLATQIDILLIGVLTGDRSEAAYYATAVGVVGRAQIMLVAGWSTLIIPTFGHAFIEGGTEQLRRAWRRSSQLWLLISLPINALLLANATVVVGVLFGTPFLPATRLLEWICAFNLAAGFLLSPAAIGALWVLDKQRLLARFRLVTAALNLVLAFLLIPPYGALGAVIATGAATLAAMAIEYELSRRTGANSYPVRVAATAGAAAAVAMVPGFALAPTTALGLGLSGGLGVLLYLGVLAAAKPFEADDLASLARMHPTLGRRLARLFARR